MMKVYEMVTKCEWDNEVLLKAELYTHLAKVALYNQEYKLVSVQYNSYLSMILYNRLLVAVNRCSHSLTR